MSDPTKVLTATDIDQQETREWLDALSAVIDKEGPERAHFLLEQLLEQARQRHPEYFTEGTVRPVDYHI